MFELSYPIKYSMFAEKITIKLKMSEDRSIDFLDYILIILKWKKFLIAQFLILLILSYGLIYFFIDEEYDSSALILPTDDVALGGISGIMKNLKDLPLGLGGKSQNGSVDLYKTLIFSRTNLEDLVKRFNLLEDYNESSLQEAIKVLAKKIESDETKENAFRITVRANSPDKAEKMVNYIVHYLNKKVIELNIEKSKNNRVFLEARYNELKLNLKNSEDSLQTYQLKSGLFEAKEQLKMIADAFSELETKVITKEAEMQIISNLFGSQSPQFQTIESEYKVLKEQLSSLKNVGKEESLLMPLKTLPEKTKLYLRYFRDVEIYNKILEFIVPLYEQAKIEEQKSIPVFQVIDYGIKPEKKSFPPRTLLSIIIAFVGTVLTIFFLVARESFIRSANPKIDLLRKNFNFKVNKINN